MDAEIPDLQPLIRACESSGPGKCFGFRNCSVADTGALVHADIFISELLVWPLKGDLRQNWVTDSRPTVFRYYSEQGVN